MYNYNYVVFNTYDNKFIIDRKGYYTICTQDLESDPQIKVVSYPLDYMPKTIRRLFGIHYSEKIAKHIDLPLKKFWYPLYFKNDFKEKHPLCFIILNRRLPVKYLSYLKKKYPDCRIVLLHRDLMKVCRRVNPDLLFNPIFDLEMTFDDGEAEKYKLPSFLEFESKTDVPVKDEMESDVFFAGRVKGRLSKLMDAYEVFIKAGIKPFYYLLGVPQEERLELPGIVYSDKAMSYYEMLVHTVNTRCILEINQPGAIGYTSRFLEAVIYGKKLITDNQAIKESKFYVTGNIQIIDDMNEIDTDFIKNGQEFVDYHYNGEFSPFRMIDRVEEELIKKYGK